MPDRVSDIVILVGIGYGIGMPDLGWAAGAFAVLTAYVRELGRASGQAADFSGPMAKPHRMAAVTLAAIIAVFAPLWGSSNQVMMIALWVIVIGTLVTAIRRSARLISQLNAS
jgi:phosphatidylglycerophosphate synthase